jgi:hypothetical protein
VWLSPDIPEEVQLQFQVKRQRQADLARMNGPVKPVVGLWSLALGQTKNK